jgi:hypothetical protein
MPQVIVAIESQPFSFAVYSFYPTLGLMFLSGQSFDVSGPAASQIAFSAKCEFSWSGTP